MPRVKIICTIGPACHDPDILEQLIDSGMNEARLNMSHGSHDYHAQNIRRIREISQKCNRPVTILGDLQGPKFRVGRMQEGRVPLKAGEKLVLTATDIVGKSGRVPLQNKEIPEMVHTGERILLDDGLLELEVTSTSADEIVTRVIVGGFLYDNKGVNLPDSKLAIPSLTVKDISDVEFLLQQQVDRIAISFVRQAQDVEDLRKLIRGKSGSGRTTPIISKIETPDAVINIREIIDASDGIMIARGDLGIETSPEAVPVVQKTIINYCKEAGVPVITATQIFDSMIRNPRPTRSEASDVVNAVLDGSDAIMLSGETASGAYPVISVQTMVKIVEEAERFQTNRIPMQTTDTVLRTIEFEPEHFQAGVSILSYFGTVLREKYADTDAKLRIEQQGLKVTLVVESSSGTLDRIEQALQEYGQVIYGEVTPEEFYGGDIKALELKQQLRIAQMQLENQRELHESTAKSLQTHRGVAGSAEFRGGFLLKLSAFPLRLRGEIDLFAVDSLHLFTASQYGSRITTLEDEIVWLRSHVGNILSHDHAMKGTTIIGTSGGAFVQGNVTPGRDFIGRDSE